MSLLSATDEAGCDGKGGEEVVERQETLEARECVHNGILAVEEDGEGESELEGEEEVLYETSSHEKLECNSGSGDVEEERY